MFKLVQQEPDGRITVYLIGDRSDQCGDHPEATLERLLAMLGTHGFTSEPVDPADSALIGLDSARTTDGDDGMLTSDYAWFMGHPYNLAGIRQTYVLARVKSALALLFTYEGFNLPWKDNESIHLPVGLYYVLEPGVQMLRVTQFMVVSVKPSGQLGFRSVWYTCFGLGQERAEVGASISQRDIPDLLAREIWRFVREGMAAFPTPAG